MKVHPYRFKVVPPTSVGVLTNYEETMKKIVLTVALATAMVTASAGFFNNNNYNGYGNDNGLFSYNPYSFFDPRWFMQEAENFVDEFDDDNYYAYNGYSGSDKNFPVTAYNPNYVRGYARGYADYETQMVSK
jgi:hypothetical protein